MYGEQLSTYQLDISNLHPCDDKILLKRMEPESGPIVITDKKPAHRGEVLKVGPGKRNKRGNRVPLDVAPGQIVHYQSFDMEVGDYILIQEADILGIESN